MALDFLPQTDWKPTAGLGGAIEGMRTAIGLNEQDKRFQEMDLLNQARSLKNLQDQRDEDTWKESDRLAKKSTNQYTIDEINSGFKKRKDEANLDQTISSTEANRASTASKKLETEDKKHKAIEDYADQLANAFPEGKNIDPFTFGKVRERFSQLGLNLPQDDLSAWQVIMQLSQNRQHGQDRQKETRDLSDKLTLDAQKQEGATRRAEIQARVRQMVAEAKAKGMSSKTFQEQMIKDTEERVASGRMTRDEATAAYAEAFQATTKERLDEKLGAVSSGPAPAPLANSFVPGAAASTTGAPKVAFPADKSQRKVNQIYSHPDINGGKPFIYLGEENGKIKGKPAP